MPPAMLSSQLATMQSTDEEHDIRRIDIGCPADQIAEQIYQILLSHQ